MRKSGVLLISLLILPLILQVVIAQEAPPGMPEQLTPEGAEKTIGELKNKTETKWDYLGGEWKNMLLKNRYFSAVDSSLSKISVIFFILFGQPYSFSITLLIIIILWLFFFFKFSEILRVYSAFSSGTSWLISLALVMIMAQLKILKKITEFLGWLVFVKKGVVWNISMIIIIILAFILIYCSSSILAKYKKKQKEKQEKEQEKRERKILRANLEEIRKGME
jgi:hypothetical protein